MARVFITGSSDGLGLMAGHLLLEQGHAVVLHARNEARAETTRAALPEAEAVLVGDVSTLAGMRDLAEQANAHSSFGAVIHNVALGYREPRQVETADGLSQLWAVNVLASYVLTALMQRPGRLIYTSSGMHQSAGTDLTDLHWSSRRWNGSQAYSETKLQVLLLALGMARHWPDVPTNTVSPGWVATRMGGPGAPEDLDQAHRTQVWLATSEELAARGTGGYFHHQQPIRPLTDVQDHSLQDRLLDACRKVSGVALG